MTFMTIGEFAVRARLSPKALRLYDQLGLVVPAQVDAGSGYRRYSPDQVEVAQRVGLLRRLGMPLATIASVLELDDAAAAAAISRFWEQVEATTVERRLLVTYLRARLTGTTGGTPTMYDIATRTVPERTLLSITRHVTADQTDAFFSDAFARLRAAAPGVAGIAGVPFLVFYGDVSDDSDGPLELCRPVALPAAALPAETFGAPDIQARVEPAHDEAYIRLATKDLSWPALLPACDALAAWAQEHQRQPAGALRQVLIADRRTASPDTPACDLTVPLR